MVRLACQDDVEVDRDTLATRSVRLERAIDAFLLLLVVDVEPHPDVQPVSLLVGDANQPHNLRRAELAEELHERCRDLALIGVKDASHGMRSNGCHGVPRWPDVRTSYHAPVRRHARAASIRMQPGREWSLFTASPCGARDPATRRSSRPRRSTPAPAASPGPGP